MMKNILPFANMAKKQHAAWDASLYLVTWNVGSRFPENVTLDKLLGFDPDAGKEQHHPDFFAIALQEVNSQPQNVVIGLFKEDPWTQKFKETLKDRDYVAIKTEQMQGLLIIFFARRKHLLRLRDIETEYTRTGLGGMWGNKGAVSIRINMYGNAIAIVNAHLAAHDNELDERVVDFGQIMDNHHYHVKLYKHILDHDYVFWLGDLNFRLELDPDITPQQVREMVRKNKLTELLENDQLRMVRRQEKAFHQFDENLPSFPPTFKFEPGTMEYDMKRRPAWTDRVLFKAKESPSLGHLAPKVIQKSYKCHPDYDVSDHKPVTSHFVLNLIDSCDEPTIEFAHIPIWYIGEENVIEYIVPHGFEEEDSDWIGVYRSGFAGLDEYLAYEYTAACKTTTPGQQGSSIKHSIVMEFSESIDLTENYEYVLLYFQSTGLRGVTGLSGMSNVFRAEKRPPSPRFEAVD